MSILNVDKIQPIGSGSTVTVNATNTILTNAQAGVITATRFDGIISATTDDWVTHQGDSNTRMGFPAVDTYAVETAGDERLRIDSSGRLLVGHSASDNRDGYDSALQVSGTGGNDSSVSIGRWSNDASASGLVLSKSRNGTIGSHTVVQANDILGMIQFQGDDGSNYHVGADIRAKIISGVGNDDMPTDLIFSTNAGSTGTTERVRITSAGKMGLGTNNPTQYFHVVGNSASVQTEESGGGIVRMQSGGSSGNIGMYSNHDLLLRTNSLERLRIDSTGGVIIGTGNDSNTMSEFGSNTGGLTIDDAGVSNTGLRLSHGADDTYLIQSSNGNFYMSAYTDNDMIFGVGTSGNERMRIYGATGYTQFDRGAPSSANKVITRHQCESSRQLDIVWHDSGSLMGFDTPGNHGYIFKCNGTERMRIHASGAVNKNYHPAFLAHRNGAGSITMSSNQQWDVIFPSEEFDNGANYNPSNGRFTAPVAGKYYFGIQLYTGFNGAGVRVSHCSFRKNGNLVGDADLFGGISNHGGTHYHPTAAASIMVECAVNDYVTFRLGNIAYTGGDTTLYGSKGTRFFGHLVA